MSVHFDSETSPVTVEYLEVQPNRYAPAHWQCIVRVVAYTDKGNPFLFVIDVSEHKSRQYLERRFQSLYGHRLPKPVGLDLLFS